MPLTDAAGGVFAAGSDPGAAGGVAGIAGDCAGEGAGA